MTQLACLGMCWNSDRFYPCWEKCPEIREWIPEMNNWVLAKSEREEKEHRAWAYRTRQMAGAAPFDPRVGHYVAGVWVPPKMMRGKV